ncbi:PREDICTED: ly-6/neurotoxin-like protein 1 [Condylura cristata]|uniref:ly-6/neurotoxin-like protein 1 n=1 Tax=Condylura cristata TaxID=143302 RepID=UPI000642DDEB|nr:PREDICTED: ly-6/neurotoxin-like protein 1 [Condylura cristata]
MRLLLGLLLVLALCGDPARGLWCHRCEGFGGCLRESRCPRGSDHCVTIATRRPHSPQDLPLVTKMCRRGCPDAARLGLGPHVSISCCQAGLCNRG